MNSPRVAQFQAHSQKSHWQAVKGIFWYLRGTTALGILYSETNLSMFGYSDADFDDRNSRTGYYFLLGGGIISWTSRKHGSIADSTTVSEFIAMAETTKEAIGAIPFPFWSQLLSNPFCCSSLWHTRCYTTCEESGLSQANQHKLIWSSFSFVNYGRRRKLIMCILTPLLSLPSCLQSLYLETGSNNYVELWAWLHSPLNDLEFNCLI